MRCGKLGFRYFIVSLWLRTLFLTFDGVEAEDKTIYAVGMGCAPGTFVTNTGCQRCPNGTFSDIINATKCFQCDRCVGKHNRITKSCTSSSNTECSCQSGYYFDRLSLFCLKCSQCKRGRGIVRNCTATSNTQCGLCVKGKTFSSEKNMEKCKPCTRCPKKHIVRQECTRRTDTVCVAEKDINNSKNPRKPKIPPAAVTATPQTRNRTASTEKERRTSSTKRPSTVSISAHNNVTPMPSVDEETTDSADEAVLQATLYGLIGLLVLLVAVLALVCCYRKKKRQRKAAKTGKGCEEPSTRTNSTDIIEAVENPYSSFPLIGIRQGGEKMLRDVSYTLINDLSQYLNPGDRWKHLGGHLNFNSTQINNFAVDRSNATQVMLQEWGQRDGATVEALQSTFRKMKWTKEEKIVGQYV